MPENLKYIDLFAGCGGLSTGLHLAGWTGVFAIERNPMAFSTLHHNLIEKRKHFEWPDWLPRRAWDIIELLDSHSRHIEELRGQIDLVVGGPPCQGFSTAGRRIEGDKRNNLVYSYLEFVKLVAPKAILFENVRGFTMKFKTSEKDDLAYSEIVVQRLKDLGYRDAEGRVIDMSKHGVPQRRKRFIVIGTQNGDANAIFEGLSGKTHSFLKEKNIARKNSSQMALSDLLKSAGTADCPDTRGFKSGIANRPTTGLQKYLRASCSRLIPDSHRFVNHSKETEHVFLKLLKNAPRNRGISGQERDKYGLKKRSVAVLCPNSPSPTVTTIPDDLLHYAEPRVMTVRECARLQTFPDWFEFKGPYTTGGERRSSQTPRYTQVGNAVPPLFAEIVGLALKEAING